MDVGNERERPTRRQNADGEMIGAALVPRIPAQSTPQERWATKREKHRITLRVCATVSGTATSVVSIAIGKYTELKKLKMKYCQHANIDSQLALFQFRKTTIIKDNDTPQAIGLKNGDLIDVIVVSPLKQYDIMMYVVFLFFCVVAILIIMMLFG